LGFTFHQVIILKSIKLIATRLATVLVLATHKIFNDVERGLFQKSAIERSLEKEERKEKKKRRQYKRGKRRKRKHYRQKHFALKGTHAKDHRYSNQKKLRRMFTNM
jgi:uncharacterized membrane protein YhiD involved in acid resistance